MATDDPFHAIVDELREQGYSVSDGLLTSDLVAALRYLALEHQQEGRLVQARTGLTRSENASRRGDAILWLEDDTIDSATAECLAVFDAMRRTLNERAFLNVHEVEAHFAAYPPGAGYDKHLDQFATGEQHRHVSLVLYLNQDWDPADGGELRLYLDGAASEPHLDISPIEGRLVLFQSAQFWHQVMPSTRQRLSLTGWFRTRSNW